ncbi:hypothetical protein ACFE04_021765 [Oxalis oulophora]
MYKCNAEHNLWHRFEEQETPGSRSFFTEIIASVSDIKFARDGRYIVSRDYMTLKLWDINMDSGPVSNFQVHEHLRPRMVLSAAYIISPVDILPEDILGIVGLLDDLVLIENYIVVQGGAPVHVDKFNDLFLMFMH